MTFPSLSSSRLLISAVVRTVSDDRPVIVSTMPTVHRWEPLHAYCLPSVSDKTYLRSCGWAYTPVITLNVPSRVYTRSPGPMSPLRIHPSSVSTIVSKGRALPPPYDASMMRKLLPPDSTFLMSESSASVSCFLPTCMNWMPWRGVTPPANAPMIESLSRCLILAMPHIPLSRRRRCSKEGVTPRTVVTPMMLRVHIRTRRR